MLKTNLTKVAIWAGIVLSISVFSHRAFVINSLDFPSHAELQSEHGNVDILYDTSILFVGEKVTDTETSLDKLDEPYSKTTLLNKIRDKETIQQIHDRTIHDDSKVETDFLDFEAPFDIHATSKKAITDIAEKVIDENNYSFQKTHVDEKEESNANGIEKYSNSDTSSALEVASSELIVVESSMNKPDDGANANKEDQDESFDVELTYETSNVGPNDVKSSKPSDEDEAIAIKQENETTTNSHPVYQILVNRDDQVAEDSLQTTQASDLIYVPVGSDQPLGGEDPPSNTYYSLGDNEEENSQDEQQSPPKDDIILETGDNPTSNERTSNDSQSDSNKQYSIADVNSEDLDVWKLEPNNSPDRNEDNGVTAWTDKMDILIATTPVYTTSTRGEYLTSSSRDSSTFDSYTSSRMKEEEEERHQHEEMLANERRRAREREREEEEEEELEREEDEDEDDWELGDFQKDEQEEFKYFLLNI